MKPVAGWIFALVVVLLIACWLGIKWPFGGMGGGEA